MTTITETYTPTKPSRVRRAAAIGVASLGLAAGATAATGNAEAVPNAVAAVAEPAVDALSRDPAVVEPSASTPDPAAPIAEHPAHVSGGTPVDTQAEV